MVRAQFTNEQRSFMVSRFYQTNSVARTIRLFVNRFPNARVPHRHTILKNVSKYQLHGTSHNRNRDGSGRPRSGRTNRNIANVRQMIAQNPRVSARRNPMANISSSTFNRITRIDLHMHPYRIQARHALQQGDLARRLDFCNWLIGRGNRFLVNMVIGDEAAFHMNGEVNTWNVRSYAERGHGPRNFVYDVAQNRQKITVWVGLTGTGQILGPFFYAGNVNGDNYLDMINTQVIPELHRIYGRMANGGVQRAWWFQDGAPAHRRIIVRDRLRALFHDRVVGLGHAREWPARSPDLTPLDFFLWGYIKSKVYVTVPRNINDLRQRIIRELVALRRLRHVRASFTNMFARARRCIALGGAQVEGRAGQV